MAATAKRVTLENILKGLLVVVVRIGKFFCWEMTKLDIRLKKYWRQETWFYRFLDGLIFPVSYFTFF